MLYDAKLNMTLPGDSPEDARKRLAAKLPAGWIFQITEIHPSEKQPDRIQGTLNVNLPGVKAHGR